MLDQGLEDFFCTLKEAWLAKKIKPSMSEEKKLELQRECEERYRLDSWLDSAAENAYKRALASHPSKFSHPDMGASVTNVKKKTYVTPIIFIGSESNDGFVRTGNARSISLDSTGNGTEVGSIGEVGALLSKGLSDGRRFFEHLMQKSDESRKLLGMASGDYDDLRNGLLEMIKPIDEVQTNSKIKQVYFPVGDDKYHLLSLKTNSGLLFEARKRIDKLRFSEHLSIQRKNRRNNDKGENYRELYNIATIGFGGTQPNNISTINNSNAGKAHLFMSMPPVFERRDIHFPTSNIFGQNIRYGRCRTTFLELHGLYKKDNKNMHVRARRDELYQDLVDYVLETLWQVRSVKDQYLATHSHLSSAQKIWLQVQEPPEDDQWLDLILKDIAQFIFHGYEKTLGKKAEKLGGAELQKMAEIVEHNREILR